MVVLLAFGAFAAFSPTEAFAHHNKGLPHYGYFENYPQTPTEQFIIVDGDWEIGATLFNFQGYNLRETSDTPNDIKFYLYIYDLKRDQNYVSEVDFYVKDSDGKVVAEFLRSKVDEEAVYSTRERLPHSGDYEIVAILADANVTLSLPIHIELNDGWDWTLILGVTFPIALLFGLAWVGKRRRRKRRF